jgi:hypothetical protein
VVSPEFFRLFSGYGALSLRAKRAERETDRLPPFIAGVNALMA